MSLRWIGAISCLAAAMIQAAPERKSPFRSDEATIRQGLTTWRTLDERGRACASCHSPDGIELAAYNFDSGTVLRRAANHLPLVDCYKIDDMIHALRRKYGFKRLLDPMTDRPMQPGGEVLEGQTPIERDFSFAKNLPRFVPALCGAPIDSLAAAKRARNEVAQLDCRTVPVGIPMNRISEDEYHGKDHSTIADWFPDTAPPCSPALRAHLFESEDRYLATPTLSNLWKIDAELLESAKSTASASDQLAISKYRAVLMFQHTLRNRALAHSDNLALDPAWRHNATPNPMWNVADFGRIYARANVTMLGFPPDVRSRKSRGPSLPDQLKQLRLAWYWSAWLLDPSLAHSGSLGTTTRGDYFTGFLWSDGPYPAHNAFMITKKIVAASIGVPFEVDYSTFLFRVRQNEPTVFAHRAIYRRFVGNSFRMSLYLLQDRLARTHDIHLKDASLQQAKLMGEYLDYASPSGSAETDRLVSDVCAQIHAARELGPS